MSRFRSKRNDLQQHVLIFHEMTWKVWVTSPCPTVGIVNNTDDDKYTIINNDDSNRSEVLPAKSIITSWDHFFLYFPKCLQHVILGLKNDICIYVYMDIIFTCACFYIAGIWHIYDICIYASYSVKHFLGAQCAVLSAFMLL